jgi:Domain of unknown function (DUF4062)
MTTVYISSTFSDLAKHRDIVAKILRQMNAIVVSMEDYTASDQRPLKKCLEDVAKCDIYIGLFAFRYGFIPRDENPPGQSITECEYRKARETGKNCLIFVADENAGWPPTQNDAYTGDGESGTRIKALRGELGHAHMVTFFKSVEDLAVSVSASVSNELRKKNDAAAPPTSAPVPSPREISADLLVAYSEVDAPYAADFIDYLKSRRLRPLSDPRALFAANAEDLLQLDRSARACHAAVVLVSDTSLRQIEERRSSASEVFGMLEARTENLFALALGEEAAARLAAWPLAAVERGVGWRPREASPPASLNERLESLRLSTGLDSGRSWVGLPVIVVAMTDKEAAEVDGNPVVIQERMGQATYQRFMELRAYAAAGREVNKYGRRRLDCRPFAGLDVNIEDLLKGIVERLNDDRPSTLQGRFIKPQNYLFDELVASRDAFSPIFTQLSSTGCVVILDEYSLFHPEILEALLSSGLLANDQVSLVTLAPSNPYSNAPFDRLETEMRRRMAAAFNRFASTFDPQCELSVGDDKRLKRWLNASLPHAIQTLRDPKPNRQNIARFAREEGIDPQLKVAAMLYSAGGPL